MGAGKSTPRIIDVKEDEETGVIQVERSKKSVVCVRACMRAWRQLRIHGSRERRQPDPIMPIFSWRSPLLT